MREFAIEMQPHHSLGLCYCGVEQSLRRSSWEDTEVCVQGVELSCNSLCERMSAAICCLPASPVFSLQS